MVLSKKDHLVGLDIGSSCIKVAEIQISKKGKTLKKFGMRSVAPEAIVEGRIMDMEAVADTIRTLFKSQKIRGKKVAISTGGQSVVIKTINTAKVPEKDLQKAILAEAEQYIPYDIADVNIDYQILGESEFSSEQMNVLLVAVKKDLVAEYMDLTAMAGLNAAIIDVDTFALQNIYETLPGQNPEEITLLLDIGASKTSLNILRDNISMMMRDNGSGTLQVIEEISARFETDLVTAENILQAPVADAPDPQVMASILQDLSNIWCSEISEAVHTFLANTNDAGISKIVLSGGGSYIQGFADDLKTELEAEVVIIEPFGGLDLDEKKFSREFISRVGPQAPIALGLALRRVDDK
ncbi:MAG: type IV pilus assembly protein PilM [Desulfotignum sp.]|nr:type IV pilus assembly protein PilM [Desulfotignum sp.]MCF8124834.1 type IV pilus assembly protein PilM [Desulfotignum sp.]